MAKRMADAVKLKIENLVAASIAEADADAWRVLLKTREKLGDNTILRRSGIAKQYFRAAMRAGLTPWPKLWQNLRSSRETELVETYPIHVVCA